MEGVNPLTELIDQLQKLSGVGPKSAQRLAFYFLSMPREEVDRFSQVLTRTRTNIRYCRRCFNISFSEQCFICSDSSREQRAVCLVAEPRDIFALERTHEFRGVYHVLGGLISPLDGIHPETLRIQELMARLKTEPIAELILAINPTVEGEATILYLTHELKGYPVKLTKLAYGLPVGGDIDYADEMTLQRAFQGRVQI